MRRRRDLSKPIGRSGELLTGRTQLRGDGPLGSARFSLIRPTNRQPAFVGRQTRWSDGGKAYGALVVRQWRFSVVPTLSSRIRRSIAAGFILAGAILINLGATKVQSQGEGSPGR